MSDNVAWRALLNRVTILFKETEVKQKYLISKNEEKNELIIQEHGELDKDIFSLLCEQAYDGDVIEAAIEGGEAKLVAAIRTENLFPIGIYAKRIAEAVINLYRAKDDSSVELFFNDTELVARGQEAPDDIDVDDDDDDSDDIDELLDDDDIDDSDFDEKDDIGKISYPLKITDDDGGDDDDEND
jgi:hypothetical protein